VSVLRKMIERSSCKPVDTEAEDYLAEEELEHGVLARGMVRLRTKPQVHHIGRPRASNLYKACMRLHVIGSKKKLKTVEKVPFNLKLTFGIGTALHLWLQNEPDIFGGRRRGFWRCMACGKVRPFGPPPDEDCPKCGALAAASQYHELTVDVKHPPFTGHPDMFLAKKDGRIRVAEFKSLKPDDFKTIQEPQIEHKWQLISYIWGCKELIKKPIANLDDTGYVFYFAKTHIQDRFPMKAFPVSLEDHTLKAIREKLKLYERGMKSDSFLPPVQHDCKSSGWGNYKARQCPAMHICRSKK
jgi:hypothetical protein